MYKIVSCRYFSSQTKPGAYRYGGKPQDASESRRKPKKEKSWTLMRDCEFLYGVQPVLSAIKARKRRLEILYVQKDINTDQKDRKEKIEAILSEYHKATGEKGPQIEYVETGRLESMVGSERPHQGVVLEAEQIFLEPIDCLEPWKPKSSDEQPPLWVALDRIQDPQNLGAIMRSCVYFGINGIVPTEDKSSPLNATVSKASAGALEWAPIYSAGNFGRFLRESKENGWRVVGTAMNPQTTIPAAQLKRDKPTILVLGNEGSGIRSSIFSICDTLARIPSFTDKVDSLNVSAATSVLLYQLSGLSNVNDKK